MQFMIGIDIGTTSVKTVMYNDEGTIAAQSNNLYPLYQDLPDMAEEDPDEIFSALLDGLTTVMRSVDTTKDKVAGVSFSCAMHSLILLDENHKPITRAITWADNRAVEYADKLKNSPEGKELYEKTGTPIHPMTPLSKLMWLNAEHKDLMNQARWFIGIKEYVIYKLFGVLQEDYSIANATGMFNMYKMDWDDQAMALAGVTRDQLPKLVDTTAQLHGLKSEYAAVTGLPEETPFVMGASDGPLANLGVNAIEPGVVAVTIGTSGAVRVVTDKPQTDPKGRLFCYYLCKDHWVVGGPVNNGGIVFRWVRDQLCAPEKLTAEQMHVDSYDLLTKIASEVPAGSDGLIFLPFLGGERAPIWDANARGTFFGLTRQTNRATMIRSALEGIVYNLYTVMLAMEEVVGKPKSIQATGGFAKSAFWRQLLSDIFEQDVTIPESPEGTALGAIVIGMYSLGIIDNLGEVSKFIENAKTYHPNPDTFPVYRDLVPIYIRLSRMLKTEYKNIAEFQRTHPDPNLDGEE
ncbi:gluconokinase [Levilactobacillus bambusae]|uniref:Gluconokinase n=1 Tax=Levilactobacillus bambusae TaxID=2024736 RepID=A0A2V1MY30_9LACO|nr:gluconokinase [Levilactobacillus bambusae]PWF99933.1 gluconokinase [Levilactobacillus bambusae]